jgi:hypothetical protein
MSWPWRCWAFGHRWTLVLDSGRIYLQCAACGSTTPGWWVRSEGLVEIVKPRRLQPEQAIDPTWENCQASWHKFHKFDDYGDDGQVRCRYCGRLFDDCLQLRDEGVLGDV